MFFDKKIDPELSVDMLRISLAKTFTGWTLDYIDSLPLREITMIQGILEGQQRYEETMRKKKR